uniref:DNA-directed DNA polymerase n=1 Tax=Schizaphis graminum TaxID=13262 RepID=A0A2S2PFU4_SCHGA
MVKKFDYDMLTGFYRGASHYICAQKNKVPRFIPVFFHNFSGYDSHLIVKELGNDNDSIKLIASTEEKYISFSKEVEYKDYRNKKRYIELRFLDSYRFQLSSLSELAKNMKLCKFKVLNKWFNNVVPEKLSELERKYLFRLLTKKLAFPYEYMSSSDKYKETKLPSKESFYNYLNNEHISDGEYHYAEEIWRYFSIKNMKEFNMLYNTIDVLLLADIMEYFRETALNIYELDPVWYYTTPGFAWDCMLKTTKQKIELLRDVDMLLMFERAKRGGISQCSNRYSKANNKYMGKKYIEFDKSSFIQYVDANNLYGYAMSQFLPYGGFEWMDPEYYSVDKILEIKKNQKKGFLFEVYLSYPVELHEKHNDLPYCPENIIGSQKLPKLLTTLYDKKNYILHYLNLQQALKAGLKLEKVHRVIQFDQSDWMKVYIDKNTNLRK